MKGGGVGGVWGGEERGKGEEVAGGGGPGGDEGEDLGEEGLLRGGVLRKKGEGQVSLLSTLGCALESLCM